MDILTLFISLRCNQSCTHCVFGCSPEYGSHMPWDIFMKALSIAKEHEIHSLNFFGGEPLVNPLFFSMLKEALENEFGLIIATNCRLLSNKKFYDRFIDATKQHRESIVVITSSDRFHLRHFNPAEIVKRLNKNGYRIQVNNWSDHNVVINDYNSDKVELNKLDTNFACCNYQPSDYIGILPDGGWQICPSSLQSFGNITTHSLSEISTFKKGLSFYLGKGCTDCLKYFGKHIEKFKTYEFSDNSRMENE